MLLLGIMSCAGYEQRRQAQRDTWLRELPPDVDYRFFVGKPVKDPDFDVVELVCDDSYSGLSRKVQLMCEWANAHKADHFFKLDDDTYLQVQKLLDADVECYDYMGFIEDQDYARYPFPVYPRAQGGPGYGLSSLSLSLIAKYGLPNKRHQEDLAVSQVLFENGIRPQHDVRFVHREGTAIPEDFISLHKCDVLQVHKALYGEKEKQTNHR